MGLIGSIETSVINYLHALPYTNSVLGLQAIFWILGPSEWDLIGSIETS